VPDPGDQTERTSFKIGFNFSFSSNIAS